MQKQVYGGLCHGCMTRAAVREASSLQRPEKMENAAVFFTVDLDKNIFSQNVILCYCFNSE
jgi:hypothetical protein